MEESYQPKKRRIEVDSDEDEGNEVDEHGVINEKVDDDDLGSNPGMSYL